MNEQSAMSEQNFENEKRFASEKHLVNEECFATKEHFVREIFLRVSSNLRVSNIL